MAVYHLHNWSVTEGPPDPYRAPERNHKRLHGLREEDDQHVTTGPIVKIEGRNITTYSGSVYILGAIDPDYLVWIKENNIEYDPENPIRLKKES